MYLISKNECSGCHACFNICPKNCISMETDKDGFLQPKINNAECIECSLCRKVCPIINQHEKNPIGTAYACINKDKIIREESSSGGIFTLIAEWILKKDGVVFGAAFDRFFNVRHIAVTDIRDLSLLRGSKYVQSTIGTTYSEAKLLLEQGKYVLFTGTPCQIAGLNSYLRKDYDNLMTLDIICHGVPSPKVWKNYIEYLKKKFSSNVRKCFFRNKETGWKQFSVSMEFENDARYNQIFQKDLYMQSFLRNLCLRESCYNCHSKGLERESDITLGDYWGIENIHKEMFDDKGVSLVIVNSNKGQKIFDEISDKMTITKTNLKEAVQYNSAANRSVAYNKSRKKFLRNLGKIDFEKNVIICSKAKFSRRVINKIKRIVNLIKI